jgi:hypothetical protein
MAGGYSAHGHGHLVRHEPAKKAADSFFMNVDAQCPTTSRAVVRYHKRKTTFLGTTKVP